MHYRLWAEWLHGDLLQQLQRAMLGIGRGRDHLEGGRGGFRATGDAGVAHDGREVLKQGTEAVDRGAILERALGDFLQCFL